MARNGSGTFNLVSGNPVSDGNVITATWANSTLSDIATGLTGSIAADGQTTITANLPMASYRHINVGAAASLTDYARADQVQNGSMMWLTSVAGTDTITASLAVPTLTTLAAGQVFRFISAGANTGTSVTLNINGLGAKAITKLGSAALAIGDIQSGVVVEITYDGTRFQLGTAGSAANAVLATNATNATNATTAAACSGNANSATTAAACSGNSATATDIKNFSSFRVGRATNQTSGNTVVFNEAFHDTASAVNLTTGVFTAPTTGYYHFDTSVEISNTTGSTQAFDIYLSLNGSSNFRVASCTMSIPNNTNMSATMGGTVSLNAGATVQVYSNTAFSGTLVTIGHGASPAIQASSFSGHYLGA
jgi:hypothetical protein